MTTTGNTTTAAQAFKDLVIAAAQEMLKINPALTVDQAMERSVTYVVATMAAERPSLLAKVAATI